MKDNRSGLIAIAILVVAVLLIGGGGAYYLSRDRAAAPADANVASSTVTGSAEVPAASSSDPVPAPSAPASPTGLAKVAVTAAPAGLAAARAQCGTIDDDRAASFFYGTGTLNASDRFALQCMAEALGSCSPAEARTIVEGEPSGMARVLGKDGTRCGFELVSSRADTPTISCTADAALMAKGYAAAKAEGSPEAFYISTQLGAALTAAGFTSTQPDAITCRKSS